MITVGSIASKLPCDEAHHQMNQIYTNEQKKKRAILRAAQVIHGHHEEGALGIHSRIFEVLVHDDYVRIGTSLKGAHHREHVVPCALLRDQSLRMFHEGSLVEEVAAMLERNLLIALISSEERYYLDVTLGLKNKMPTGWQFGVNDPLDRLKAAGIVLR